MELPLGDKRQLEDFRARLKDVVSKISYEGNNSKDTELYLENLSKFVVDTTEDINNTYRTHSDRGTYKDGFSPAFLINKFHLQAVIEIRRHLLGKKGRRRWCSSRERTRDLRLIISTLHNRSRSLGLSDKTVLNIFKETKRGPDWWLGQEMLRAEDCEDEIRTLKKLMHGRKRCDNRRKWRRRTAWLEKCKNKVKLEKSSRTFSRHMRAASTGTD